VKGFLRKQKSESKNRELLQRGGDLEIDVLQDFSF
jgi:hypothetical protein